MKYHKAVDEYFRDMRAAGRINSDRTVASYRRILEPHGDDVNRRDPRLIGRDDVKRTLARWPHPNTQRVARAVLVSFYDWMVEEGHRPNNPARQTRRPKKRPVSVYRMTADETRALMLACRDPRERRAVWIGCCAGLRRAELLGLQGKHLERDGFIWVSSDIAKGGRERWVPVIADLEHVIAEIRANVGLDEYVLPSQRWRDPPRNTIRGDLTRRPSSPQALFHLVKRVAARAGIPGNVGIHTLRHAFADHVARQGGVRLAQEVLGHAELGTTQTYLSKSTPDALREALKAITYGLSPKNMADSPMKATTGIEPVTPENRSFKPFGGLNDPPDPSVI